MPTTFHCLFALGALLIVSVAAPQSAAQDTTDQLRRQNEQLEAKVADLESALVAARARIAELQNLLSAAQSSSSGGATLPVDVPIAAGDTSPSALEAALRDAFAEARTNANIPEGNNADAGAYDPAYQRWLKKWITGTVRTFRKQVSWTVVLEGVQATTQTESVATIVAWDIKTNEAIGKPFPVTLSTRSVERVRRLMRLNGATTPLTLAGVYTPRLILNPDRIDRGPFDNPPFIGPMVELRWSIDAKSLSPLKETKE